MVLKDKKKAEATETKNVTVSKIEEPTTNIHEKNKDIVNRQFVYPLLAEGVTKLGKNYPDLQRTSTESRWLTFKNSTDFSIPVKRIVTKVIRIRTLSNKDQALGEYVYYLAKLIGYKKHFINEKVEIYPSAEVTDVPFGMDIKKSLSPSYKAGQLVGYDDKGEHNFYTEKFLNTSIKDIIDNSDDEEGNRREFLLIDAGSVYGNFTQEEIETCKLNRLIYRSNNKLNGTEIKEEDKLK